MVLLYKHARDVSKRGGMGETDSVVRAVVFLLAFALLYRGVLGLYVTKNPWYRVF
jgi:hypothetical protein